MATITLQGGFYPKYVKSKYDTTSYAKVNFRALNIVSIGGVYYQSKIDNNLNKALPDVDNGETENDYWCRYQYDASVPKDFTEKVNKLWDKEYPTVMTISDNSSTTTSDKMKIVITNTGDNTHPTMSLTGTKVYTPYSGSQVTTVITTSEISDNGTYATYADDVKIGKTVYTFTDATSGKSVSMTFRHAKVCYLWVDSADDIEIKAGADTMSPLICGSSIKKVFSANLDTDSYIYVAVPKDWTVSQVTAHSNISDTVFVMAAVESSNTEYNIYKSTTKILNTNGNTAYVSSGTGSIN